MCSSKKFLYSSRFYSLLHLPGRESLGISDMFFYRPDALPGIEPELLTARSMRFILSLHVLCTQCTTNHKCGKILVSAKKFPVFARKRGLCKKEKRNTAKPHWKILNLPQANAADAAVISERKFNVLGLITTAILT